MAGILPDVSFRKLRRAAYRPAQLAPTSEILGYDGVESVVLRIDQPILHEPPVAAQDLTVSLVVVPQISCEDRERVQRCQLNPPDPPPTDESHALEPFGGVSGSEEDITTAVASGMSECVLANDEGALA